MCGDGLKMAQGTYTGTGTSGQSNPNTLTAGFQPKVFFLATGTQCIVMAAPETGSTATSSGITYTFSETGVSWYASSAGGQGNELDTVYNYTILG